MILPASLRSFASKRPQIGSTPEDRALLSECWACRHVAAALYRPPRTVGGMFDRRALDFLAAPDPTEHLRAAHRANSERQVHDPTPLRVLTYNVALLDLRAQLGDLLPVLALAGEIPWLGLAPRALSNLTLGHVVSPELELRRAHLPELIFSAGDDVVLLQEVWRPRDAPFFSDQARRHGYLAVASPRTRYNDGLMTFVSRRALSDDGFLTEASAYTSQVWTESLAGVQRGYHRVSFRHAKLGGVHVFNTHLQAYPPAWQHRMSQARELGLAARAISAAHPDDVIVLGGDLNSGPYYRHDVWRGGEAPIGDFWRNAVAYAVLEHYSGLADAALLGVPAEWVDADVRLAGQCNAVPCWPHTADAGANRLYAQQYNRDEPPARLDHIRVNTTNPRVRVTHTELAFTDSISTAAGLMEPSDHYGVRVQLQIAPQLSK